MPQDDSWWPETNGHDVGSELGSQFETAGDTQGDEEKDMDVEEEGKNNHIVPKT